MKPALKKLVGVKVLHALPSQLSNNIRFEANQSILIVYQHYSNVNRFAASTLPTSILSELSTTGNTVAGGVA